MEKEREKDSTLRHTTRTCEGCYGYTVWTRSGQEDDSKPKLVIYAVLSVEGGKDATAGEGGSVDTAAIRTTMQKLIKSRLNPLFGISEGRDKIPKSQNEAEQVYCSIFLTNNLSSTA